MTIEEIIKEALIEYKTRAERSYCFDIGDVGLRQKDSLAGIVYNNKVVLASLSLGESDPLIDIAVDLMARGFAALVTDKLKADGLNQDIDAQNQKKAEHDKEIAELERRLRELTMRDGVILPWHSETVLENAKSKLL